MIYIDANIKSNTSSANNNVSILEEQMPAFMEYIDSLPSVHDLFRNSVKKRGTKLQVLYSDKDIALPSGEPAYVFRPQNEANKYKALDIHGLLR